MLLSSDRKTSDRELRWFAGIWFPALCAIAGATLWRTFQTPQAAWGIWIAGAAIALSGLIFPVVIRPIYSALLAITFPIAWLTSHLLLMAMYFLVFTPIGFLVRLFIDPMERRFDRAAGSYWLPRTTAPLESYFRQL